MKKKIYYANVKTFKIGAIFIYIFRNWCVQFFPSYIAPNVLTFLGFSLTVLNFILIGYYDYHFKAATLESNPIPKVVWIVAAFNMFIAYTLVRAYISSIKYLFIC